MTFDDWLHERAAERERAGLRRTLRPRLRGEGLVDLAGNDYLGLTTDRRLAAAAADAARTWGAGAGASRLVTGSTALHAELESALAAFTGRPAALVFSTGYHANLSAVSALCDADTLLVSDAHVHASLVDACRLAHRARLVVTPHNDVTAVERALVERTEPRAIVLCESVYSVLGDAAPVAELVSLTAERGAVLVVDEAHAIGVAGPNGRGLLAGVESAADHLDRHELSHVVVTLTLSKALGAQGGAVLASRAVVDHLVNVARPFIYDTGLAPPATAAALRALRVVQEEPALPRRALELAARLSSALDLPTPAGAVLSVPMPGPAEALAAQARLAEAGFAVGCFRPPSVPDGVSRLRLTANASLSDADVEKVLVELRSVVGA
jgi:8-amino-7-oxononanoate synthase